MRCSPVLAAAAASASLIAAAPAAGATRYAEPDGDGPAATCPQADPCDLQTAVEDAAVQAGDEVVVLPGTYLEAGDAVSVPAITVRGQSGAPRPEILSSANFAVDASGGAVVRRLRITHTGGFGGLFLSGDATAERLIVDSIGSAACAVPTPTNATIRDSVCWQHGGGSILSALEVGVAGGGPYSLLLRNVTAVASGDNGLGIKVAAGTATNVSVFAKSVIASGAGTDVFASGSGGGMASITLDHSNYATESHSDPGGSVTEPGTGTNQTDEPTFVDAAGGDFRQFLGSATIDEGDVDNFSGILDLDGEPRTMGPAPDIGADEFNPAPPKTAITKHPVRRTTKRRAKFKFVSDHPGSSFECRLDRETFAACDSPATYKGLERAKHVFRVKATDELGKVDPTSDRFAWKIVAR